MAVASINFIAKIHVSRGKIVCELESGKTIGKISHLVKGKIFVGCWRLSGTMFTWRHCAGREFTMMDSVNPSSSAADGGANLRKQNKQMSSPLYPRQSRADCPRNRQTISRIISAISVVVFHRFPT